MMRRNGLVGILAAAVCVLIAAPAFGHPKGQRPVLLVSRDADGLQATWLIAPDDAVALPSASDLVSWSSL